MSSLEKSHKPRMSVMLTVVSGSYKNCCCKSGKRFLDSSSSSLYFFFCFDWLSLILFAEKKKIERILISTRSAHFPSFRRNLCHFFLVTFFYHSLLFHENLISKLLQIIIGSYKVCGMFFSITDSKVCPNFWHWA